MTSKATIDTLDKKIDRLAKRVDKRFDEHDKRFDVVDKRFDEHDKRFDKLFKRSLTAEERLDNIEKNMATKDDINNLTNTIDKFMKQVNTYYLEMLSLKVKVDRLEGWITKIANKVDIKLES